MPSIFDTVSDWAVGTTYKLYDIVKYNGLFYYSLKVNNVGNTPSTTSTFWGGYVVDADGSTQPHFFFKPSYSLTVNLAPRVKTIQFGDGYSQRVREQINNNMIKVDLAFNNRTLAEITAISHFIISRESTYFFLFTAPPPFHTRKRFVCKEAPVTINFHENFSLNTTFEEVPA